VKDKDQPPLTKPLPARRTSKPFVREAAEECLCTTTAREKRAEDAQVRVLPEASRARGELSVTSSAHGRSETK
jgi:hypothetical protein